MKRFLKKEKICTAYVAGCHGLPTPSDFTVEDWKPIMAAMAPKAKLTAEETNWVLAYVNANAKK